MSGCVWRAVVACIKFDRIRAMKMKSRGRCVSLEYPILATPTRGVVTLNCPLVPRRNVRTKYTKGSGHLFVRNASFDASLLLASSRVLLRAILLIRDLVNIAVEITLYPILKLVIEKSTSSHRFLF